MLAEVFHATLSVSLLALFVGAIWVGFTDLPLAPLLVGEAMGFPAGVALLVLSSPRHH